MTDAAGSPSHGRAGARGLGQRPNPGSLRCRGPPGRLSAGADQDPKSTCSKMMISAKNVTPSISAAAMIIAVWMLPAISGWRAMLSTADLARPPMPKAAPMMTRPAPIAFRSEKGCANAGRRGLTLRLGERRTLDQKQHPECQDGGLDEFHRTLHSLLKHRKRENQGLHDAPPVWRRNPLASPRTISARPFIRWRALLPLDSRPDLETLDPKNAPAAHAQWGAPPSR